MTAIDTNSQRKNFSIFENINQENTSEHAIYVFYKETMFEVKCHNDFCKFILNQLSHKTFTLKSI